MLREMLDDLRLPETLTLTVRGRTRVWQFTFRIPRSYREWNDVVRNAENCVQRCRQAPPPEYAHLLPIDDNEAQLASFLAQLLLSPQMSELEALEFVREVGIVAANLIAQLKEAVGLTVSQAEQRTLELEKKDSS